MRDLQTERQVPDDADTPTGHTPADGGDPDVDSAIAGKSSRGFWAELPVLVIIALVLAILLKTFVIQAFYIPSSSMEPTLLIGDRVLVTKTAYEYRDPRRGEVVVFEEDIPDAGQGGNVITDTFSSLASGLGISPPSERDFIKRIIGLPGETIELRQGVVYINGQELPEAATTDGGYLSRLDLNDFGPVTVEPDHYFMLGDNRPNSSDSRFGLGQISREQLLGRAFVVIWPLGSARSLPIADYP
ncbi:MAG: signal peptidase I [Euzebya sp.]